MSKPVPSPTHLTGRRKAALIVQMMLREGGKLSLTDLPEDLQELLAIEMAAIRLVDKETVDAVANEFASLLEAVGHAGPGKPIEAIGIIAEHVSPTLAKRLKTRFGLAEGSDPWERLRTLDDETLGKIITRESTQVGAVTLSKLSVEKAAALLSNMDGERARGITLAMRDTAEIAPSVVERIGRALLSENSQEKIIAFEKGPVDRLGAILNNSTAMTRETLLTEMEQENERFANDVRKAIFTFADIPTRLTPTDVPNVLRAIDPEQLTLAMAASLAENNSNSQAAEFILNNVSQRMANSMREEASEKGSIKPKLAEEAMNMVAASIKEQADSGAITFLSDEEEEA